MNARSSTLVLAALAALGFLLASAGQARAEVPVRVAILPLQVNSLDRHDYLRQGLADMLSSRIGRHDGVAVVRADDPKLATTSAEAAREAAAKLGADYVVYGSFTAFGGGASLDLECTGVRGEATRPKEVFVQAGTLGAIIPELDGLAERIARFARSGEAAPPVAAGPPAGAPAPRSEAPSAATREAPDADLEALQALEARVQALERIVFSEPQAGRQAGEGKGVLSVGDPVEEVDLRADPTEIREDVDVLDEPLR